MAKIRLGFVGVGNMGQAAHLRNYATLPDCEIAAIAELRPGLGRRVAARYEVGGVYTDHRAMLANETLDALVAIQPFQTHGRLIPELLASGLPVLTEKPLAGSVAAGEAIANAARQSTGRLYVAYHKRSDPATVYARHQIDQWRQSGAMGKMRYVRIAMPPGDWAAAGFTTLVKSDEPYPALERDAPAGDEAYSREYDAFVNYYIHQVNLMRHLLGEEYRVVYADPSKVLLVARSASGVTATLEMATHRTTREWQEEAFIAFEKGWINVELPAPLAIDRPGRVTVYSDPGGAEVPVTLSPTLPPLHAMRQQAMFFLQAIRGERTPLCEADEALKDLYVARDYLRLLTAVTDNEEENPA